MSLLSDADVSHELQDLPLWERVDTEPPAITATYELADFIAAIDFVTRVGHEAERMDHHPDIDIRWDTVKLVVSSHSAGGLTAKDFELAHRISRLFGD